MRGRGRGPQRGCTNTCVYMKLVTSNQWCVSFFVSVFSPSYTYMSSIEYTSADFSLI